MKLILFLLLLTTSCAVTTEVAPVTPSSPPTPGTVSGEQCRSVFQFVYAFPLFLLSNYPDGPIGVSMKKLAALHGGSTLVDVTWSHTFTSYVVFARECVRYSGTVAKAEVSKEARREKRKALERCDGGAVPERDPRRSIRSGDRRAAWTLPHVQRLHRDVQPARPQRQAAHARRHDRHRARRAPLGVRHLARPVDAAHGARRDGTATPRVRPSTRRSRPARPTGRPRGK
jgi:hypothetical protein